MTTAVPTSRKTQRILMFVYGAAFLYFTGKLCYYTLFIQDYLDPRAQLSYIIEMCLRPSLLPDFASMPMYDFVSADGGVRIMKLMEGHVNYLGHPPLYYLLMSLTGSVSFSADGTAAVDCLRLSAVNIALASVAVILAFRCGRRYLEGRSPLVHAVYAAAVVTLPELGYVGAGVNNDNLAFLAFVIFTAGLLRYQEDRTDLKAYLLIGIGFLLGSLSKLTMAMIMIIALLTVLVMSVIRTRSLKLIANRAFLITLPCYLAFLAYELAIHRRYGVWHPGLSVVAPEYFMTTTFYVPPEERAAMSLPQYLFRFMNGIRYTWSSLYGHNSEVTELMNNGLAGLVYWIVPAAAAAAAAARCIRRSWDRITLPVVLAFLGTLAYHFYSGWSGVRSSGYTGGIQARYYLPLIVPFALIFCDRIPPMFRTQKAKTAGSILAAVLIACWLAGDFPRLVFTLGFSRV